MKLNKYGTGILVAAFGAAAIAVGMVVQSRSFSGEHEKTVPDKTASETASESLSSGHADSPYSDTDDDTVIFPLGDVSDDGVVNTADYILLLQYLCGGYGASINEVNSDVNRDGSVDMKDVETLRRLW